jgi:DNA repair exonuclease SbcCD nuclease subunit
LGWLTGAGHNSPRESGNLAAGFGRAKPDLPHVAMLHAHVTSGTGPGEHEIYAPCSRSDLESGGFDYWALGHIHRRHRVFEDLPAWYSGNIQGRNPRETGQKGVLYAEVAKGGVQHLEFIPLAPVVWDWLEIPCPSQADSLRPLADALASEILRRIDAGDGREHFVRADLTGQSPLAEELALDGENLRTLVEEVQAGSGVSRLEIRPVDLTRPVEVQEYRGSETVLGEALDLLDRAYEDDRLLDRLRPAHLALRSEPDEREYLRSLLRGMDRELAARLLPDGNGS